MLLKSLYSTSGWRFLHKFVRFSLQWRRLLYAWAGREVCNPCTKLGEEFGVLYRSLCISMLLMLSKKTSSDLDPGKRGFSRQSVLYFPKNDFLVGKKFETGTIKQSQEVRQGSGNARQLFGLPNRAASRQSLEPLKDTYV